jgi:hypothetical protein
MHRNLRIFIAAFIFINTSCDSPAEGVTEVDLKPAVVKKKQVAPTRTEVNKVAAATFSKPIEGEALQGTFAVNIYETAHTFDYLMKIRYAELYVTDTLTLPDLGTQPAPVIKDTSVPKCLHCWIP